MKPRLTLYLRLYCHLCEEMLGQLRELQRAHDFELEIEDVDDDPRLFERYNTRVPVLSRSGEEICHYHLDRERLLAILDVGSAQD